MNDFRKRLGKKAGFTLVELLVVIAIIAILSVTAFITLGGETVKARDSKRMQDLSLIQNAMEIIFINEGRYPDSPLTVGTGDGQIKKQYLSAVPTDPRGMPYVYAVVGATYLMAATLEKDGTPGNYETYLVGNGEQDDLFGADDGVDRTTCGAVAPTVCNLDGTDPDCIPYCP